MSDEFSNHPDLDESQPKLWTPSPALRGRLFLGMVASLAYGGLVAAAALSAREQEQAQPVTPALVFLWASMIPATGIMWSYLGVAREVENFGLRKSTWCTFGIVLLWQLAILGTTGLLPDSADPVRLCAIAAGSIGLLLLALYLPSRPALNGSDGTAMAPKGSKAGWGGVGLALLLLLKFASQFLLRFRFGQATWEMIVLLFLVACTIGFVFRFALCKIQLRGKLGGLATVTGVAEIAGLLGAGVLLISAILAIQEVIQPGGNHEKELEDLEKHWTSVSLLFAAGASLAWASLTALLLVILWHRQDPEADWLRDLRNAERGY
jgi:hypothetical protein